MRELKFRVWDKEGKKFLTNMLGIGLYVDANLCHDGDYYHEKYIFQQFIGLTDKNNKKVYEGDIIEFIYTVGDFAWEEMSKAETKKNTEMSGKKYVGVVEWNDFGAGFNIIVGNSKSTHLIFPAGYIKNGRIVGNICEKKNNKSKKTLDNKSNNKNSKK